MNFRLTPQAQADVESIGDSIAFHDARAAATLMLSFRRRWTALSRHPYAGRPCDHLVTGLRRTVVGNYATFYRPADDGLTIVRVMHTRRHVSAADLIE